MDYEKAQYLANLVVTLLVTPLAMLLWSKLQKAENATDENEKNLAAFKLHAAEQYATKNELAGSMERLERTRGTYRGPRPCGQAHKANRPA